MGEFKMKKIEKVIYWILLSILLICILGVIWSSKETFDNWIRTIMSDLVIFLAVGIVGLFRNS